LRVPLGLDAKALGQRDAVLEETYLSIMDETDIAAFV
tara:strand:+ start:425 stop:535 length:111 start_codon:yes stop_codon:yes gene_type:complete